MMVSAHHTGTREAEADLETWLILTKVMNLRPAWAMGDSVGREGRMERR